MNESTSVSPTRQTTAREFLAVVFRRRALILGLFLATTVTILVIAFSRPMYYQSAGRVLVKRGEKESLLEGGRRYLQWEEDLASEVQVIQSQTLVDRAAKIMEGDGHGRVPGINAKMVGAEVVGESNVILIGYSARDPKTAQRVADAVVRAYIEYRNENYTLAYPTSFFSNELRTTTEQLTALESERREFATSANAINPQQQSSALLGQQQALRQRLTEIESDLAAQRMMVETMQRVGTDPDADLAISSGQATVIDNALAELKRQILQQATRVAQLRERYVDESPEVRSAQQTLATLREMLAKEVKDRLEGALTLVRASEERRRVVQNELDRITAQLQTLPAKESRLAELDRRIAVLRDSYQELSRRSDQARIAQATSSNITVILLSAPGPAAASNTRDYVRLALAPIFSLLVGLGLAFFVDSLDTTVRTAGEAEQALELPVLATLGERRRHG